MCLGQVCGIQYTYSSSVSLSAEQPPTPPPPWKHDLWAAHSILSSFYFWISNVLFQTFLSIKIVFQPLRCSLISLSRVSSFTERSFPAHQSRREASVPTLHGSVLEHQLCLFFTGACFCWKHFSAHLIKCVGSAKKRFSTWHTNIDKQITVITIFSFTVSGNHSDKVGSLGCGGIRFSTLQTSSSQLTTVEV